MNKVSVYLAGSCKNVSIEERNLWRDYITKSFKDNSNSLVAFNPNEHFSYEKNNPNNERLVMDFFLHNLCNSGIVVVNLNNSDKSVGTGIEFGYALAQDKFIIGFGNQNVYEYMREKCSIVLESVDEVVSFLLEHWD